MEVEHLAGFGHTFDAADELPHDLRPLRVAEIHAVRRRQGHRAHSCDIAPAFGNRLLAALVRVGIAIARRAIGADRDTLARTMHPYDSSIATGALDGVRPDQVVLLLPYHATARANGPTHNTQ